MSASPSQSEYKEVSKIFANEQNTSAVEVAGKKTGIRDDEIVGK